MIDLEPHSDTLMRVYRDTRWLLPGTDHPFGAWEEQTTIAISSEGRVEIETASDRDAWEARSQAWMRGQGRPELDTVTAQYFSIPEDHLTARRSIRVTPYCAVSGHDRTPMVLAIPTPEFGDWSVFVQLIGFRGHELAPRFTFRHDESAGAHEPLTGDGIDQLLIAGAALDTSEGSAVVELADAGSVRVPTGQLAAADPGWITDDPRTVRVPPGDYPVTLSLMRFPDGGKRVGAARVSVTDAPVRTWEMALGADEDPLVLGPGQFYGVGVDTGYAAFFDASHGPLDDDTFDGPLLDALEADLTTDLTTAHTPGLNLIAFRAGLGDGAYPLWIGRAADDEVSCVVVDFQLVRPNS